LSNRPSLVLKILILDRKDSQLRTHVTPERNPD
jgi:hypothetical protein